MHTTFNLTLNFKIPVVVAVSLVDIPMPHVSEHEDQGLVEILWHVAWTV